MIVDDDEFVIEMYKTVIDLMPGKDYAVTEISANEALRKLDKFNRNNAGKFPDYILLDLRMPEMHGFDFIKKFIEKFPDKTDKTDFIITTSSVMKTEKEEASKFSCVKEYLTKPIPFDFIEKIVNEGLPAGC